MSLLSIPDLVLEKNAARAFFAQPVQVARDACGIAVQKFFDPS